MRRYMFECRACGGYCTIRDREPDKPERCPFWKEYACWVRIGKEQQKLLGEFEE